MASLVARYAADESGATAIEYGLIVSLIAVAIVGVLGTLGMNLRDKANEIAEAIGDAGRR
jgi:pilus assembly protein Flp/PilA